MRRSDAFDDTTWHGTLHTCVCLPGKHNQAMIMLPRISNTTHHRDAMYCIKEKKGLRVSERGILRIGTRAWHDLVRVCAKPSNERTSRGLRVLHHVCTRKRSHTRTCTAATKKVCLSTLFIYARKEYRYCLFLYLRNVRGFYPVQYAPQFSKHHAAPRGPYTSACRF